MEALLLPPARAPRFARAGLAILTAMARTAIRSTTRTKKPVAPRHRARRSRGARAADPGPAYAILKANAPLDAKLRKRAARVFEYYAARGRPSKKP